jgi:hypothetical protein
VYPVGGMGVFEAGAHPGSRLGSAYWTDPSHQLFFIYGGAKADQNVIRDRKVVMYVVGTLISPFCCLAL